MYGCVCLPLHTSDTLYCVICECCFFSLFVELFTIDFVLALAATAAVVEATSTPRYISNKQERKKERNRPSHLNYLCEKERINKQTSK